MLATAAVKHLSCHKFVPEGFSASPKIAWACYSLAASTGEVKVLGRYCTYSGRSLIRLISLKASPRLSDIRTSCYTLSTSYAVRMEKHRADLDTRQEHSTLLSNQRTRYYGITTLGWVAFALCGLVGIFRVCSTLDPIINSRFPVSAVVTSESSEFNWHTSPVYAHLQYSPCYSEIGDFQCARLELPLDYWNGTTNATLSLAVIRKPAVVPITDPRYAGPVLVNPGGPGGSGIEYVVGAWQMLRHQVDSVSLEDPNGKFFDIVSFDPRGVGFSTPNVHCFADSGLDQGWQLRVMEEGVLGASDATFGRLWSMAKARAGSCSLPLGEGKDIKPYVTTAHTARDMLELIEKHGQWRESQALAMLSSRQGNCHHSAGRSNAIDRSLFPEALKYEPDNERLMYNGGSYGTYLGLTFAAMFPDRIHRLRVDGVMDADDYRKGLWTGNLRDTEKEVHQFYYHCARAGFPACALANATGETTTGDVETRTQGIINSLLHNPLAVIGPNPEVITYSDAKHLIFAGLYEPMINFPVIANLLAGVEQGNGTLFAEMLRPYHGLTCQANVKTVSDTSTPFHGATGVLSPDSTMAISCADGDDQSWMTKEQYSEYWKELARISPAIGPMWSMHRMYCIHYSARPVYRFTAPFEANTSHPILLMGTTADPVTPLKNAFKMSKGYPGSVVLTQNSTGHTSDSVYSSCTVGHIRTYFHTGELPQEGTVCEADEMPFGESSLEKAATVSEDADADDIKSIYREGNAAFLRSARSLPGAMLGPRVGLRNLY
jgi:pimeloyl-ACP methyl ester carboxylesterase